MWTLRLLFFGNYPSLNRVFMCCHCIKSHNLMTSVSCSNTLTFAPECWKYILRSPDFNFFSRNSRPETPSSLCPPTHLFLFSHLLKILLKTLLDPCPLGKWPLKVTCLAKKSTCPRPSDTDFYKPWSVGKHCIWFITCGAFFIAPVLCRLISRRYLFYGW